MILARLKHDTEELHEEIERSFDFFDASPSRLEYRQLLERFYGYYQPLEIRLASFPWESQGFDWSPRRKTELLELDLAGFGERAPMLREIPRCERAPRLLCVAQALGCLYVLEGSTLGGQVITRMVRALPRGPFPVAFFSSYGERVGAMWKSFGAFLTNYSAGHDEDDIIVESAKETFITFGDWLSKGRIAREGSRPERVAGV